MIILRLLPDGDRLETVLKDECFPKTAYIEGHDFTPNLSTIKVSTKAQSSISLPNYFPQCVYACSTACVHWLCGMLAHVYVCASCVIGCAMCVHGYFTIWFLPQLHAHPPAGLRFGKSHDSWLAAACWRLDDACDVMDGYGEEV